MATIHTAIELQDNFTGVLYQVVNAVNMGVAAMSDLQQGMNGSIDTASFEAMRDSAARAAASLDLYSEARQRAQASGAASAWQTDRTPVFTTSGTERFAQEVESVNAQMGALYRTQTQIAAAASRAELFPPEASADITAMQERLGTLQRRMAAIESDPLNMGTDAANAQLEHMRGLLGQALDAQEALNSAVDTMDVGAANRAYLQMSQSISNAERYIRDNTTEQEKFTREVERSNDSADRLFSTVRGLVGAYVSLQSIGKVLDVSDSLSQTTARLDLMNQSMENAGKAAAGSTQEMLSMVYNAAQNARGSFSDMAEVVAKFGNNAGDAFSGSDEVVAFAELVQKQMKVAGASTMESANAMLQLSQALGSGVLRGDELNSIFEQAPNLIQNIADYLDVPLGSIREMASEGQLTADIVKAAMFDAAEDINERFNNMPMTWGDIWTSFQNDALMAFQPVLEKLNDMANSEPIQRFADGAAAGLYALSGAAMNVLGMAENAIGFIADNWASLEPILAAVAAAAAVLGTKMVFSAVMSAGAWAVVHLPLLVLTAVIVGVIGYAMKMGATFQQVCGTIGGIFGVLIGTIYNLFVVPFWNAFARLANFIANVFNDPVAAVKVAFYDMCMTVIGYIRSLVGAIETLLNKIPGIELSLTSNLDGLYSNLEKAQKEVKDASGWVEVVSRLDFLDTDTAWNAGYGFGEGAANVLDGLFDAASGGGALEASWTFDPEQYGGIADGLGDIAGDTGKIAESLEVSQEDLKFMRDIAERDTINRFTTAEIKIEQTNHNNIASNMDLDGIVDTLTNAMSEAVAVSAKGAHA